MIPFRGDPVQLHVRMGTPNAVRLFVHLLSAFLQRVFRPENRTSKGLRHLRKFWGNVSRPLWLSRAPPVLICGRAPFL